MGQILLLSEIKNVLYVFVHIDHSLPTHFCWLKLLQKEVMGIYIVISSPHSSRQNYFISGDTPSKPARLFLKINLNFVTIYGIFLVVWFTFQLVYYQPSDYLLWLSMATVQTQGLVYLFRITLAFQLLTVDHVL